MMSLDGQRSISYIFSILYTVNANKIVIYIIYCSHIVVPQKSEDAIGPNQKYFGKMFLVQNTFKMNCVHHSL